ncbi:unnamed protein product, partial [marine sediment metagenome]
YFRDGLTALEKLVKIVLDDEDPTTVTGHKISTIYWQNTGDEYYRTNELEDKNIEKVRAHKNNKFLVYFTDEEKARKVAQALLNQPFSVSTRESGQGGT